MLHSHHLYYQLMFNKFIDHSIFTYSNLVVVALILKFFH